MSIGRAPKSSPPGIDRRTRPQRVSSGPSTLIDARIRSTSSYGATGVRSPSLRRRSRPSTGGVTRMPIASSRSPRISTSTIAGTLVSSYSPSARIVAAISLSTAFLAPGTSIVPCSSPTRRMAISPPGPGSVFTMHRRAASFARSGLARLAPRRAICSQRRLTTDQYAPVVLAGGHIADRPARLPAASAPSCGRGRTAPRSPPTSSGRATTSSSSAAGADGSFEQAAGPFSTYRRTCRADRRRRPTWRETTTYGWSLPWFAWLFALPLRWTLARRGATDPRRRRRTPPPRRGGRPRTASTRARSACSGCWRRRRCRRRSSTPSSPRRSSSPPTTSASATAASASPARVVRAGIILVLPFAAFADRIGRRRMVTAMAIAAPLVTALGALAPTFPILVATQTLGRPLGLALDFLIAVVAAEEMPRNSRAYAISVLAMASGLGAGVAVIALPLADISAGAWRYVYVVALIWLRWPSTSPAGCPRPSASNGPTSSPHRSTAAGSPTLAGGRLARPTCSSPRPASSRTATSRTPAGTRRR